MHECEDKEGEVQELHAAQEDKAKQQWKVGKGLLATFQNHVQKGIENAETED